MRWTDEKIEAHFKKQEELSGVKIGDIFYHIDEPNIPWEVIRSQYMSGVYFWIASFENRGLRLCKRVELYDDSIYFTYFRTIKEAMWQKHSNEERKLQILTDNLNKLQG